MYCILLIGKNKYEYQENSWGKEKCNNSELILINKFLTLELLKYVLWIELIKFAIQHFSTILAVRNSISHQCAIVNSYKLTRTQCYELS